MDWTFSATPQPYGLVHWLMLCGIGAASTVFYLVVRKQEERKLLRLLFVLGIGMLFAEAWKQWFVVRYVYRGTPSMWFFPWQLCSIAMYVSTLAPFWKGRAQDASLVFLCTFSVVGAVFALLFPEDMMRDQILLFCHSFLYHTLMLFEAILSLCILKRRAHVPFLPALVLFFGTAAVAEVVNVCSHLLIRDIRCEANMFYITPFYPSTQPVFSEIAAHAGIFVEILVYLGCIALASFLLYLLLLRTKRGCQSHLSS